MEKHTAVVRWRERNYSGDRLGGQGEVSPQTGSGERDRTRDARAWRTKLGPQGEREKVPIVEIMYCILEARGLRMEFQGVEKVVDVAGRCSCWVLCSGLPCKRVQLQVPTYACDIGVVSLRATFLDSEGAPRQVHRTTSRRVHSTS